jgi:PAS domain S-box-containing protein
MDRGGRHHFEAEGQYPRRFMHLTKHDLERLLGELADRLGISVWAAHGPQRGYAICAWSRGAEQVYGYDAQHAIGRNYLELFVKPALREPALSEHLRLLQSGSTFRMITEDNAADGTIKVLLVQGAAMHVEGVREPVLVEVGIDLNEFAGYLQFTGRVSHVLFRLLTRYLSTMPTDEERFAALVELGGIATEAVRDLVSTASWARLWVGDQGDDLTPVWSRGVPSPNQEERTGIVRAFESRERDMVLDGKPLSNPDWLVTANDNGNERSLRVAVPLAASRGPYHVTGVLYLSLWLVPPVAITLPYNLNWLAEHIQFTLSVLELADAQTKGTERLVTEVVDWVRADVAHSVASATAHIDDYVNILQHEILNQESVAAAAECLSAIRTYCNNLSEEAATAAQLQEPQKIEVYRLLQLVAAKKSSEYPMQPIVKLLCRTDPVYVKAVPYAVRSAVENVLTNAMEATRNGGNVTVIARCMRGRLVVAVLDNGPGISETVLHRIWERGYSTKSASRGYGLFRTRQVIEEMDGEVRARRRPSGGTMVVLVMPLAQED